MILQTRSAIIFLVLSVLVGSAQTCREQAAKNSSAANLNMRPAPGPSRNMSNQNSNKDPKGADEGVWGGLHVRLVLTSTGGEIEFDCAHGQLSEPLKGDARGRFDVAGTLVREGGPVRQEGTAGQRVRYSGRLDGDRMTLTLTLSDSNEKPDEFSLTRDNEGRLWKCK
jgi:hypothetical protein